MKNTILILLLTLFTSTIFASEVEAIVVFQNFTQRALTSGEFRIIGTNQKIAINKEERFKITLPKKGEFKFSFISDDFTTFIFYPSRITRKENVITIHLMDKIELKNIDVNFSSGTNMTDEQMEQRLMRGTLNFIIHGVDDLIPEEYISFKEKYGIGLIKENCVIDPLSFKKATENNLMIFKYLNRKHGSAWLNELQVKPFGIK